MKRAHESMRLRARAKRGYTLIEVMMGVALSAIGILGIAFMQTTSVRSNQDAYESSVASNFARTWLERVKRDALLWTMPGDPAADVIFAGRPNAGNSYFVPNNAWTSPRPLPRAVGPTQESSGANYHGVEVGSLDTLLGAAPVTTRDIYYCAHLRFEPVQVDAFNATVAMGVDVRVYWARKGSVERTQYDRIFPARDSALGCDDAAAIYTDAQVDANVRCDLQGADNYCMRVHYLRTIIRMVPPT